MSNRRALVIWPPQVPSYFNAGHHLQVFLVGAYLRATLAGWHVSVLDAGALNVNWKAMADALYQGKFSLVAIANDLDAVDGIPRLIAYARELCPTAKLVTFGRLSSLHPELFTQFDLDGIVWSGDYEPGVAEAARLVRDGSWTPRPGLLARDPDGVWPERELPGVQLDPEAWVLPDVTEIPYAAYDLLYARDEARFCGIPDRRELVVPVSRGCPVGCEFCDVPDVFGLRERRLPIEQTVEYIESAFERLAFEYVAFYAPTFTLNRRWVLELCDSLPRTRSRPKWKCATTVKHLDEELVRAMGRSGCVRISVGLETLDPAGHASLPRVKRYVESDFRRLASWCEAANIELNAFVMVALTGTSLSGTKRTVEFARALGARVRPTMYTPYHAMDNRLNVEGMGRYNRHFVHDAMGVDQLAWYDFLFAGGQPLTAVQDRIPRRSGLPPSFSHHARATDVAISQGGVEAPSPP